MCLTELTVGTQSQFVSGEGNAAEYLMIAMLKEFFIPFNLQGNPIHSSFTLLLPANSQLAAAASNSCCANSKQMSKPEV